MEGEYKDLVFHPSDTDTHQKQQLRLKYRTYAYQDICPNVTPVVLILGTDKSESKDTIQGYNNKIHFKTKNKPLYAC
ncbi:hypothetical protein BPAE_0022g00430 [Botrytis paeoniae]|uniref:Uncharacterized protein n=1 Tax=Botrytis paeoniae TaxID=278948 RepID=A0A4Z1G376_9HELO|nr:hypothetical protein BPAE_0022g00430 [Botrytis paeoniae]